MYRSLISFLLLAGVAAGAAHAADDEDLLPVEEAFRVRAEALGPDRIQAVWELAEGYYLYRDKLRFTTAEGGPRLGDAVFPAGKTKQDDFFGAMEVYWQRAEIDIPVIDRPADATNLTLTAYGQGCNEPIGVCYPPFEYTLAVALPPTGAASTAGESPLMSPLASFAADTSSTSSLSEILQGIGSEPEFLHVDEAFQLDLVAQADNTLLVNFQVAPGYYLYRDKISVESNGGAAQTGKLDLPPGKPKKDAYFGDTIVYPQSFQATAAIVRAAPEAGTMLVKTGYQGCAERGICYPPVEKTVSVSLPSLIGTANAAEPPGSPPTGGSGSPGGSWFSYLLVAFGAGLLLTFTPCVLPMIPFVSSIIVAQGPGVTRRRAGSLAITYVLGTAATYAVIGAVAGATGEQLQAYFQNAWFIGSVAAVLAVMALSMFGLFQIQMPSAVQSALEARTRHWRGGTYGMVFFLGLVSALIVGACVSPLLVSVLSVAMLRGDAVLGAAIMFAMALGMGVILVAIGFGASALLPRAGPWMEHVKQGFGVALVAVAIYLLGTIPAVPVLLLWAALLIVVAVYLGATQGLPAGAGGWRYLFKGVGTVMLVWGVLALIGSFTGNRDILRPVTLNQLAGTSQPVGQRTELFIRVSTPDELDAELRRARLAGKLVMLDYYADWCVDCVRMENNTFRNVEVYRLLQDQFVLLQVDVTDPRDPDRRALKRRFDVFGPPAILFFDRTGGERQDLRLYGYRGPDEFLDILKRV